MDLQQAKAKLAELDRKARELDEDIQKDDDQKKAGSDIDAMS